MKTHRTTFALLRLFCLCSSIAICHTGYAIHGTSDAITDSAEIDGDLLIDLATGTGISISGEGKTVTLAPGYDGAVVTINGSYGISAQNGARVELGKVIINESKTGTNFSLSARGDGAYISVGDNSIMNNRRMGGVVNTYVNGVVKIGNNVSITGISSSLQGATVWSNSGVLTIGDGANITADGTIDTGLSPMGYVKTIQANNGGTVNIGKNATITAKTDGYTGNHAVVAGVYYNTTEYGAGTVNIGGGANISTNGATAYGLTSAIVGSNITLGSGSTIFTTGSNSHAVYAERGGAIELHGATIRTSGSNANAITATSATADVSTVTGNGVFDIKGQIRTETRGKIDMAFQDGSIYAGYTTNGTNSTIDFDLHGAKWDMTANSALTSFEADGNSTLIFKVTTKTNFIKLTTQTFSMEDSVVEVNFTGSYTAKLNDEFKLVIANSYDADNVVFNISYDISDLGFYWDTSFFGVDGTIRVAEIIVPEPATFAAVLGFAVLFAAYARRRAK